MKDLTRNDVVSNQPGKVCHKHVWEEVSAQASLIVVTRTYRCVDCGKTKKVKDFLGA